MVSDIKCVDLSMFIWLVCTNYVLLFVSLYIMFFYHVNGTYFKVNVLLHKTNCVKSSSGGLKYFILQLNGPLLPLFFGVHSISPSVTQLLSESEIHSLCEPVTQ